MSDFKLIMETPIEQSRYQTRYTKEPETISWVDSFADTDVFIDIGANIGIYSLYCASRHAGIEICAVEPVEINYRRLKENIALNNYTHITCYNILIGMDAGNAIMMYSPDMVVGDTWPQEKNSGLIAAPMAVITGDTLIAMLVLGNKKYHIKIDVDGTELDVLASFKTTLRDTRLDSILIEYNIPGPGIDRMTEYMMSIGFTTDNKFNTMTPHSRERRALECGNMAVNVIYTRQHCGII